MEDKALKYILSELKEKEHSLLMSLGDGGAMDFAAYRDMCGQIRGLLFAQNLITDLLRKMELANDE